MEAFGLEPHQYLPLRPALQLDDGTKVCDWRVEAYNCADQEFLQVIYQIKLWVGVVGIIAFFCRVAILLARAPRKLLLVEGSTINALMGLSYTMVIGQIGIVASASVILYRPETSLAWVEFLYVLPILMGSTGLCIFLAAIVEAVPQFVWDERLQRSRSLWIPSRRVCNILIAGNLFANYVGVLISFIWLGAIETNNTGESDLDWIFILIGDLGCLQIVVLAIPFIFFTSRFVRIMNIYLKRLDDGGSRISDAPGKSSIERMVKHISQIAFVCIGQLLVVFTVTLLVTNYTGSFTVLGLARFLAVLILVLNPISMVGREILDAKVLYYRHRVNSEFNSSTGETGQSPTMSPNTSIKPATMELMVPEA